MGTVNHRIRKKGNEIFLAEGLDRGDRLEGPDEMSFSAHPHGNAAGKRSAVAP
ncbi:hypothetical protein [Bradyrhizobium sp. HKCCYLS2033]|uniref:hypothetical protein n=1 Tax=Bradyrhizobium sp. HKCCYLS2033 TaxID=3420739 RepID=UPI003EBFFB79